MKKSLSMEYSLSVVIPNYNNEKYIERCIKSVIDQTYNDLKEVIIIDDASTDLSKTKISLIARIDNRIKPVFLDNNGGVSYARNRGLDLVTSKYVTFLDGDDYYYNSKKLEKEMKLMLKHYKKNKNAITYSAVVRVSNDGSKIYKVSTENVRSLEGNIYNRLLLGIGMERIMRDYCVETKYLKSLGGYNEENCFFEDYELILKLARHASFYSTLDYGTAYRDSVNGLSKKSYKEQIKAIDNISFNEIAYNSFPKKAILKIVRKSINETKKLLKILMKRNTV